MSIESLSFRVPGVFVAAVVVVVVEGGGAETSDGRRGHRCCCYCCCCGCCEGEGRRSECVEDCYSPIRE